MLQSIHLTTGIALGQFQVSSIYIQTTTFHYSLIYGQLTFSYIISAGHMGNGVY